MATYFIPNPEGKTEVNHKDFNKNNNNVTNLEWVTPEENCSHFRDNSPNNSQTSGRHGTLYKDGVEIGKFRSLNKAKQYCRETYGCTLCSIGERNVNVRHRLVYLRTTSATNIQSYLIGEQSRVKEAYDKKVAQIKSQKGLPGYVVYNGEKFYFKSIREANEALKLSLRKRNDGKYKCHNYELKVIT